MRDLPRARSIAIEARRLHRAGADVHRMQLVGRYIAPCPASNPVSIRSKVFFFGLQRKRPVFERSSAVT